MRKRLRRYSYGFGVCSFGIAGLEPFIRPDGWAIWVVLPLLLGGIFYWRRMSTIMRDLTEGGNDGTQAGSNGHGGIDET